MASLSRSRFSHYAVLALVWAATTLPFLGAPSLWDNDEGLNAEAAREMYESGNWIVPRFNFQLRDAKPALLYWLQASAFHALGVNEFAARLPSALAALVAVFAVYELGRSMFAPSAGLIAGVVLMTSTLVCGLAHFANPDALLLAGTALTFLAFWRGFAPEKPGAPQRRSWFMPVSIASGFGVLAKGPVALALPGLAILLYLAWQRQLRCLWDRRLLLGIAAFMLVAMPWYTLVTVETRGAYFRGFILKNNVDRYLAPMGDHRGPIYYHPAAMLLGFAPWSAFLLPVLWYAIRACRRRPAATFIADGERPLAAGRLLVVWFVTYLLFFSGAATKLPGYALPLYPALALMTGRFLHGWTRGEFRPHGSLIAYGFACLALIGVGTSVALLAAGGVFTSDIVRLPAISPLRPWAWLGVIPILGAVVAAVLAGFHYRQAAVAAFAVSVVGLFAGLFGPVLSKFDEAKASRPLMAAARTDRRDRDLRLGCYLHPMPSLVFYGRREVQWLATEADAARFLGVPTPAFLVLPGPVWDNASSRLPGVEVVRHFDLYRGCDVVIVTNVATTDVANRN